MAGSSGSGIVGMAPRKMAPASSRHVAQSGSVVILVYAWRFSHAPCPVSHIEPWPTESMSQ